MNIILYELTRRFDAIGDDVRDFEFWLALKDYIDYIENTPSYQPII